MYSKIKIMSIKNLPSSDVNPFLEPLANFAIERFKIIHTSPKTTVKATIDKTGQKISIDQRDMAKATFAWKDSENFTKVFRSKQNFDILKNLSKNARTLLDYIEYTLEYKATSIILEYKRYIEALLDDPKAEYKSAYYRGIKELCEANILHKKSTKEYHINPFIIFNGRREDIIGSVPNYLISDKNDEDNKPYKIFNNKNKK